jgi:tRNA nucleotidyltransferase (CCA-adding enzyme)
MRSVAGIMNQRDIPRQIEKGLTAGQRSLLQRIREAATAGGLQVFIIGGFVRDLLLGHPAQDFDLVVEGDAVGLARSLAVNHGGKVAPHERFGTAQWFPAKGDGIPEFIDLISARSETYAHPGALPSVQRGTIDDDIRRRDFTINTLALRIDGSHYGELRDDLDGLSDLKNGLIRALHPGSYQDDPTRILRAVRYEQRYGFQITPQDLAHLAAAKHLLGDLSGERLRHELDLILAEEKPVAMLERISALGIMAQIHPSLPAAEAAIHRLEFLAESDLAIRKAIPALRGLSHKLALAYLLWLMELDEAEIETLAEKLDLTAGLREALLAVAALRGDLDTLASVKASAITMRLDRMPPLAVYALNLAYREPFLEKYLTSWRYIKPKATGHTLMEYGLEPGPIYQRILDALRAAWLDGEIHSPQEEQQLLDRLVHAETSERA